MGNPASNVIDMRGNRRLVAHKAGIPAHRGQHLCNAVPAEADRTRRGRRRSFRHKIYRRHGTSSARRHRGFRKIRAGPRQGKFPYITEPDPSYHGVRFTEAAGAAAYIVQGKSHPARDTGSALSPFNAFLFPAGARNAVSQSGSAISRTL